MCSETEAQTCTVVCDIPKETLNQLIITDVTLNLSHQQTRPPSLHGADEMKARKSAELPRAVCTTKMCGFFFHFMRQPHEGASVKCRNIYHICRRFQWSAFIFKSFFLALDAFLLLSICCAKQGRENVLSCN